MKEKIKHVQRNPFRIIIWLITRIPYFNFLKGLQGSHSQINFNIWFLQKIVGFNRKSYFPTHHSSRVVGVENILVGVGSNPGLNHGCYVQGNGKLYIGNYCTFGPNTGLMSGNHDFYDNRKLTSHQVTKIGDYCWVGMGALILPGVEIGDFTIVAAGSVVTKSFSEGYCVIAGNPAKLIKPLDKNLCIRFENARKYHGYIKAEKFERYRQKYLKV